MRGSEGRRFRKQGEWNSNQAPRLCGHNRQRRPAISREPLTNTPSRTRAGTGLSESYSEPQSPESRSNDAQAAQLLDVSPTKHLGRSRRANVRFGSNLDGKFGWKADIIQTPVVVLRRITYALQMHWNSALTLSLVVCLAACSCSLSSEGLSPDLNISLDCSQPLGPAGEIALEKGLYSVGFDVLNKARLARELRVDFSRPTSIDAIDQPGRMVSVTGFEASVPSEQEKRPFYLAVSLYSRPPTSRDAALEAQLEKLAGEISMCSVAKVERHSNPASIEWLYNDIAKRTRGWFEQAQREAPASNTRRVHDRS